MMMMPLVRAALLLLQLDFEIFFDVAVGEEPLLLRLRV